jgi:GcrA cell cycle regulator
MPDQPHAFPGRDATGRFLAGSDSAGWTPQRIDRLLALAAEGLSSSVIAAELGHVTRNAVVGKLNRLRRRERQLLAGHSEMREVRKPRTCKPRQRRSPPVKPKPESVPAPDAPPERGEPHGPFMVRLLDVRFHHCRWPIGDPRSKDFRFCGFERENTSTSYCAHHHQVSRQ